MPLGGQLTGIRLQMRSVYSKKSIDEIIKFKIRICMYLDHEICSEFEFRRDVSLTIQS